MARDDGLRHLAFFEALTRMTDDTTDWSATSAGLVVLRLVDAATGRDGLPARVDRWELAAVRGAVAAVDAGDPARPILAGIVEAVERCEHASVTPRLMAFGRALDFGGRWALAADVYEAVIARAELADADLVIDANFRLAYCRRVLGELDVAERVYMEAGRLSAVVNDDSRVLRAEVGVAKVATARGNLPAAGRMLDTVIARAARLDLTMLRALALHDRAVVAIQGREHEHAVRLLHEALPHVGSPSARDRVLADIANAFLELGVRSAARDALMVVAATAEEQYSRWGATINLMHIAALDGFEPAFEAHRRQLATAALTPELSTNFEITLGRGYRLFGHDALAGEALARCIALAETHGFNRQLFEAEQERDALERGVAAARRASVHAPSSLAPVADEMRSLRLTAVG